MPTTDPAPIPLIESRILLIRGNKVLLDSDLAALYQVETRRLNEAVQRNRARFPADFMFQLTQEENEALRSQIAISNEGRGGRRYRPYVFTEQGIAMLSSVLRSQRAIDVNIAIMRTFVRLRQLLATHEELARRLEDLEWRQSAQAAGRSAKRERNLADLSVSGASVVREFLISEQGQQIQNVFETIQYLIEAPAEGPVKRFGFPSSHIDRSS